MSTCLAAIQSLKTIIDVLVEWVYDKVNSHQSPAGNASTF